LLVLLQGAYLHMFNFALTRNLACLSQFFFESLGSDAEVIPEKREE